MPEKTLIYRDRALRVRGLAEDAYFQHLSLEDGSNDFFAAALARLPAGAVTFDVGANIGLTAAMAAQHAQKVYAFEPSPRNFGLLGQTIEANGLAGRVEAVNSAVGARAGELAFFDDANSGSASHLITGDTMARQAPDRVAVVTLDGFAAERGIERLDLVKIDIEGFEIDALEGAEGAIAAFRPAALVEFNAFTMVGFRNINPRAMIERMRALFPYLYWWQGRPVPIATDADALGFLHHNLVSAGCVDDLYGSFKPWS